MSNSVVVADLGGLIKLRKDLPKQARKIELRVARKTPFKIIENIKKRREGIYFKGKLPKNEQSTINRKGHDRPLIDTGLLTSPFKWVINRESGGYVVRPPHDRQDIVQYLADGVKVGRRKNKKHYYIMRKPRGYRPTWVRKTILEGIDKYINKFR